ncbi:MAG: hypothetical protein MUE60_15945 [Candidatus Eisenbacteria bacterium]|jgi:hypothetical protein|nr:hypothetical protein [Candidatus Eisenbacteria bacterium]
MEWQIEFESGKTELFGVNDEGRLWWAPRGKAIGTATLDSVLPCLSSMVSACGKSRPVDDLARVRGLLNEAQFYVSELMNWKELTRTEERRARNLLRRMGVELGR